MALKGNARSRYENGDNIDFKVSGLPHSVVKQAENSRVRELVKKIESHPHRQDLQADLQQCYAYNPFSEKSKKMIRVMGNVEQFESCETIPKVQCAECLLYWNQGIVYCTCGHLLREDKSSRYSPMAIGYSLNPELCHQEGVTSWQSSWEDGNTKRTLYRS